MSRFVSSSYVCSSIVRFLEDHKAHDVISIELKGKTSLADFMIIASGSSQRQIGAMADLLMRELKGFGSKNLSVEGTPQCDWVLVDAGDIIIHLFRPGVRELYHLESLWGDHATAINAKP